MSPTIKDYLEKYLGSHIYFYPNPGNAGDSLINSTTYQLLRNTGIDFTVVTDNDNLEGKIVFYGGGGNFVSYYTNASSFISKWHNKVKHLVVLPSTINSHSELLAELGKNVDIICREQVSYQYVKHCTKKPKVYLMNDLAFNFNLHSYRCRKKLARENFRGQINQSLLRHISNMMVKKSTELNSYRDDKEMTDIEMPHDNIDIAKLLESADMGEEAAMEVSNNLLFFIDSFDLINTNRLHICICGILLGKRVNFYPNSYYKNEAVYNFSINNIHNRVSWKG